MAGNAVLVNWSNGETSPKSRGRFDLPWYPTSAEKMQNFIAEISGPARYRPGFRVLRQTRGGATPRLARFQVNNSLGFTLEFTPGYMRVYSSVTQDLLTTTQAAITSITAASPGAVTVQSAAGLAIGNEVILSGLTSMPQLNNRQFLIAGLSGATFNLADPVTGVVIDTSSFTAEADGGIASLVYEVATVYTAADLLSLQWAQSTTVMYLVCPNQAPYKLTVDAAANFTLATFSRTADPFAAGVAINLAGIALSSAKTLVRFVSGTTFASTGAYAFAAVTGTVEINGGSYTLTPYTGGYTVQFKAVGFVGAPIADGDRVTITSFSGILSSLLTGNTYYVQALGAGNVALFYDSGLKIPVQYGTSTGNFGSYSWTGSVTMVSGAAAGTVGSGANVLPFHVAPTLPSAFIKLAGANVDSSGWTAYVSGGTATPADAEHPVAVAFYEGRLGYFGTTRRPDCFFLSRSPDGSGNSRYDDFTGGTAADNACFFQIAPTGGSTSYAAWARGGPDYLFVGTFGGPYRVSGSGLDIPITPSSINVRQFDAAGCEGTMAAGLAQMFFVQRGGTTVRAIKVINPYLATFESADMCLNAEQIPAESAIQRIVFAHGRPDMLWAYRADGVLCGMSVHITAQNSDVLTGWHRHKLGGAGKVVDLAVEERATGVDRLWSATKRILGGVTRCYVEVMTDEAIFPDVEEFFTSKDSYAADLANFQSALYRAQEDYIHLDGSATYDGSARGAAVGANLTPGAVSGTSVVFSSSSAVFKAGDVGSELWKKPNAQTGVGGGRALITGFTDASHVVCSIDDDGVAFDSTAPIAAGDWYFAVSTVFGLPHLEGLTPAVVADGAVITDGGISDDNFPVLTVANGSLTIPQNQAMIHVGLPYVGMLKTHNLEMGGRSGPAQAKPRNICGLNMRFLNTLGVEFGTDLYKMQKIDHRVSNNSMDRPAPVFSGIRLLAYEDTASGIDDETRQKNVVVCQRLPLPAIIQSLDVSYDTTDEGGGQG